MTGLDTFPKTEGGEEDKNLSDRSIVLDSQSPEPDPDSGPVHGNEAQETETVPEIVGLAPPTGNKVNPVKEVVAAKPKD